MGEVDAATPGLHCCTYLRPLADGVAASRIAFVQDGTGIYSSADGDVGGIAKTTFGREGIALLTIDKPGISVDPSGKMRWDRAAYREHTLADLAVCARNAVEWAADRRSVAKNATLIVHGHSEGAQTMVRMLAAPSPTPSPERSGRLALDRIELVILSGLLMEPMAAAAERQLAIFVPFEIEAFHRALEARDDDYLLGYGMPWRYLTHPMARESLDGAISELARRRPGLRVEVFHGERDLNAPIGLVRELAEKNRRAQEAGAPSLAMHVRVYRNARHDLDARVRADMTDLVASLSLR